MWDGFKKVFGGLKNRMQENFKQSPLGQQMKRAGGARTPGFVPESVGRDLGQRMPAGVGDRLPVQMADGMPDLDPLGAPTDAPTPMPRAAITARSGGFPMGVGATPPPVEANNAPAPKPYSDLRREATYRANYGTNARYDDPLQERRLESVYGEAVTGASTEERQAALEKIRRPSVGDRFKGMIKPAVAGALQGYGATGDWRGAAAGAGTAAAASGINPEGGRDYAYRTLEEPRARQELLQSQQARQVQRSEEDALQTTEFRRRQMDNLDADNKRADEAEQRIREQMEWTREDRKEALKARSVARPTLHNLPENVPGYLNDKGEYQTNPGYRPKSEESLTPAQQATSDRQYANDARKAFNDFQNFRMQAEKEYAKARRDGDLESLTSAQATMAQADAMAQDIQRSYGDLYSVSGDPGWLRVIPSRRSLGRGGSTTRGRSGSTLNLKTTDLTQRYNFPQ